jgi:Peptidase family M48
MIELLLIGGAITAVALPHAVPLRVVSPAVAAVVWLTALGLRAVIAAAIAISVLVYLPQTALFHAIAEWCFHVVIPITSAHLGIADTAVMLPALTLAGSLLWVALGLLRAALALRARLARRALGPGPRGTILVEEPGVLVAVTRLGRTRVLVSRDALRALDDAELDASLAHEWGHVRRRHRPVLFAASLLASIGRWLPGTRVAARELRLSLERDADAFAVRSTSDPLALASAICKAAPTTRALGRGPGAVAGLGGRGGLAARLEPLLGDARPARGLEIGACLLAILLVAHVVALAATVPAWALSRPLPVIAPVECHHHHHHN